MRKNLTSITFLSTALLLTTFAFYAPHVIAKEERLERQEERQENRQERQGLMKENAEERQEQRQENRSDRQENRQESRDDRAQKHAERLEKRFGFYYERLQALLVKITARIANLLEEGKDVAAAQAKVTAAQASLDKAKLLGQQAVAAFKAIEPSAYEAQREQALAARDLAKQAREQYKSAVRAMREAVALLKVLKD